MKKLVCTLAAVLLVSLFCASALAAIPVNANVAALIGEDGTVIVEPGEYAQFIDFGMPGLFAAQTPDGKFLIVDETGTCRGNATYDYLENVNGTILYARGEKYGVLDAELNELVPCEYTWLVSNGEGGFLALRTDIWDDSPDGVYLIDESGYVSPTGVKIASILWPFSGGMSPGAVRRQRPLRLSERRRAMAASAPVRLRRPVCERAGRGHTGQRQRRDRHARQLAHHAQVRLHRPTHGIGRPDRRREVQRTGRRVPRQRPVVPVHADVRYRGRLHGAERENPARVLRRQRARRERNRENRP